MRVTSILGIGSSTILSPNIDCSISVTERVYVYLHEIKNVFYWMVGTATELCVST